MTEDDILDRLLPLVPRLGWTRAALAEAAGDAALAENAFPRGPRDAIAAWVRLADRRMEEAAAAEDISALRTPARIRRVIVLRLEQATPHKEALRMALAALAAPWNAPLAAKLTAGTVSAMWYAAGDTSADFSWYTRRATLAAVYGATLAFWLRDDSEDMAPTLAFLDRRLADLARIGRPRRAA
jgi:ubiquinone biosynthesis protein COQ9